MLGLSSLLLGMNVPGLVGVLSPVAANLPGTELESSLTQLEKLRFEARVAVMRDTEISYGARVLYWYLDDMANFRGSAFPRQTTAARAIGASVRQIRRFFRELEGRHITSRRKLGTATTRLLRWAAGTVRPPVAPREAADGLTKRPPASCTYLVKEPVLDNHGGEMTCETCKDQGRIAYKGEFLFCNCAFGMALLEAQGPAPTCPKCQDEGRVGTIFEERRVGAICDCRAGEAIRNRYNRKRA